MSEVLTSQDNGPVQVVVVEWFGNKAHGIGFQGLVKSVLIGISGYENHRTVKLVMDDNANIDRMIRVYKRRRRLVVSTLRKIGIRFKPPKGTFYLWVPTPKGMSSLDFTDRLFEKTHVVVAAGTAYGKYGDGYIRISLTVPDDRLEVAMQRIEREFS